MQIKRELPPNYEEIVKTLTPSDRAVFTWGDTVFAPQLAPGSELPPDLMVHEEVHEKQQGNDPEDWWRKYLDDPDFRLEQELQAYGVQYAWVNALDVKRDGKDKFLDMIAGDLSSPMYGLHLTHAEAVSKIRNKAKEVIG